MLNAKKERFIPFYQCLVKRLNWRGRTIFCYICNWKGYQIAPQWRLSVLYKCPWCIVCQHRFNGLYVFVINISIRHILAQFILHFSFSIFTWVDSKSLQWIGSFFEHAFFPCLQKLLQQYLQSLLSLKLLASRLCLTNLI